MTKIINFLCAKTTYFEFCSWPFFYENQILCNF